MVTGAVVAKKFAQAYEESERLAAERRLAQLEKQAERDRSLAASRLQEREATGRQLLTLQAQSRQARRADAQRPAPQERMAREQLREICKLRSERDVLECENKALRRAMDDDP